MVAIPTTAIAVVGHAGDGRRWSWSPEVAFSRRVGVKGTDELVELPLPRPLSQVQMLRHWSVAGATWQVPS